MIGYEKSVSIYREFQFKVSGYAAEYLIGKVRNRFVYAEKIALAIDPGDATEYYELTTEEKREDFANKYAKEHTSYPWFE